MISNGLFIVSVATLLILSDAHVRGTEMNENEGRYLDRDNNYYYKYYRYNNRNRNRRYYYGQNNYYRNGGGHQGYYNNYHNNNNNNNNNNGGNNYYYNGNVDANDVDDNNNGGDDVYGGVGDDKWTTYDADDSLSGKWSNYEKEAEEQLYEFYQTPPGDWTSAEWGFVLGTVALVFGLIACLFKCCCCCCGRKNQQPLNNKDSFDGYVTMDSKKSGLLESESESTDVDDDSTYDPVMRLRSLD